MKRQRAFLAESSAPSKKSKLTQSVGTLTMSTVPKPLSFSAAQKREISKMISMKEEVKYYDILTPTTSVSTLATNFDITGISQGVQQGQRIGNSMRVLSIKFNWWATVSDPTNVIRLIVWTYKSNSALTSPSSSIILANGSSGAITQTDSQYNYVNRKDYKIHLDKSFNLSTAANPLEALQVRINIPQKYQQVDFSGDGVTTGSNHLIWTVISDSGAVAHPTVVGTVRVFYQDA